MSVSALAGVLALLLSGSNASAQQLPRALQLPSASEIAPPSYRPQIEAPSSGAIELPASSGPEAPAGADKLFVRIGGVTVEGGFPELAIETSAIEATLMGGQSVPASTLFAAARSLEAAYAQAGFVLARVVLPKQALQDGGTLKLIVVDGYIEGLDTANVPGSVKKPIEALVQPLVGKRRLRLSELERRVLLAGDTAGVVLRSSLTPGAADGAAMLALSANYQPVNVVVSVDNALPQAFGTWTFGLGLDVNSVLGLGELFYLRGYGNPFSADSAYLSGMPQNRALAAGVVVPIGADGFTVNIEGTKAQTMGVPTVPGFVLPSSFERLSFRARYPWLRTRLMDLSTEVAFDFENDSQSVNFAGMTIPLSEDRLRVARFSVDGQYGTSWQGSLSGRLALSTGLNVLGARTAGEANQLGIPLSRQGADASFTKLEASFNYLQPVFEQFTASLQLRGQTSFGSPLARAERFGIAMPTALSTFDGGTFIGDSGYSARAEFGRPTILPPLVKDWSILATPYVFGAVGQVVSVLPTVLELGSVSAASYGIGLRLFDSEKGTRSGGVLVLEFGGQQRSDGVPAGVRANLTFNQRF